MGTGIVFLDTRIIFPGTRIIFLATGIVFLGTGIVFLSLPGAHWVLESYSWVLESYSCRSLELPGTGIVFLGTGIVFLWLPGSTRYRNRIPGYQNRIPVAPWSYLVPESYSWVPEEHLELSLVLSPGAPGCSRGPRPPIKSQARNPAARLVPQRLV